MKRYYYHLANGVRDGYYWVFGEGTVNEVGDFYSPRTQSIDRAYIIESSFNGNYNVEIIPTDPDLAVDVGL